jgi:hypothetical protein
MPLGANWFSELSDDQKNFYRVIKVIWPTFQNFAMLAFDSGFFLAHFLARTRALQNCACRTLSS